MQDSKTPNADATRVALVLDAGGARSAYQVGALEVLLPALAERSTRPRLLVGTSAGALLTGALSATAHLEPDDQIARLKSMLGQTTKQNVMRPLWRQVPEVLVRYASETLGLSYFRLRGLFGSQPLANTLCEVHRLGCPAPQRRGWCHRVCRRHGDVRPNRASHRVHRVRLPGTALGARVPRALRRHPA